MLNYRWFGVLLGIAALLLRMIAGQFPEGTEIVYSRTVFPIIRQLVDKTLAELPFPSVYLFVVFVLGIFLFFFFQLNEKDGLKRKTNYLVRSSLNFSGILVFFFLLLWGYNYQRVPVYRQLFLEPTSLTQEDLIDEMELTHDLLRSLRPTLTSDTLALEKTLPYGDLERKIREKMKGLMPQLGFDSRGNPRTREFYPAGLLRRMGIVGIYFPFTGEGYIDPSLHDLEKPFTVAHEMAHGFGITNEGEANFISWLAGAQSGDPLLQYSAHLQLFRYQLNDLYRRDREDYRQMIGRIDPGIKNDMLSILRKAREFPPFFQDLSRRSNDLFLKTQGVKAGVKSYTQLPALAHAWRKKSVAAAN